MFAFSRYEICGSSAVKGPGRSKCVCVGGLAYLIITTCRLSAGKVSAVDRLVRLAVRGEQMQGLQESLGPPSSH